MKIFQCIQIPFEMNPRRPLTRFQQLPCPLSSPISLVNVLKNIFGFKSLLWLTQIETVSTLIENCMSHLQFGVKFSIISNSCFLRRLFCLESKSQCCQHFLWVLTNKEVTFQSQNQILPLILKGELFAK